MKTVSRREALRVFAAAPVAAPAAAEAIAGEAMSLTKVATLDEHGPGEDILGLMADHAESRAKYLQEHGVPKWQEDGIRDACRSVSKIDPDIVSFRSVSLSRKIGIQRERNIQRQLAWPLKDALRDIAREKFFKTTGQAWW